MISGMINTYPRPAACVENPRTWLLRRHTQNRTLHRPGTLAHERMEPGICAQGVEVRIFRRPILVKGSVLHHLSQATDGVFAAARKTVHPAHFIENDASFVT